MYIYIYIHMHTYTHTYIHTGIYSLCVYIYIYIYIYITVIYTYVICYDMIWYDNACGRSGGRPEHEGSGFASLRELFNPVWICIYIYIYINTYTYTGFTIISTTYDFQQIAKHQGLFSCTEGAREVDRAAARVTASLCRAYAMHTWISLSLYIYICI